MRKKGLYERFFKRLLDLILSFFSLIILSPFLLIIALLVRVKLGTPVIFKQKRPGLNEKIFTMYKFRTMTNKVDGNGKLLSDDKRLTKFGKFLRSSSLDELPGLLNIIKGDMSIIGPRPLLIEYLPLYNKMQKTRHDIRPGLTGYAQINGRNAISWEQKFNYDIAYINKLSFLLDTKIFFKTVEKVLKREGISSKKNATMEQFLGSEKKE